ncbi:hypothetical protein WS97_20440 [Burkholderia territorii]|nr:hypothetical protein WS97_20440 [Burkholderia territorii]
MRRANADWRGGGECAPSRRADVSPGRPCHDDDGARRRVNGRARTRGNSARTQGLMRADAATIVMPAVAGAAQ